MPSDPAAPANGETPALPSLAGMTIAGVLRRPPVGALETRILLSHALQLSRVQLITQSDRSLSSDEASRLASLLERRMNGEPLAYITGEREFHGLPFHVTPAVLIPRPETELLVELVLQHALPGARVLDLGTGSGAIAVSAACARADLAVTAIDVSPAALAVARRNAARNGAAVEFMESDWYRALGNRQFDVIVSNPPYITGGDRHLSEGDLRFEPIDALTDHADGLSAFRTIIADAAAHLADGGRIFVEHGYDQAAAVRSLLGRHGLRQVQSWRDLAGIERVSGAMQ